VSQWHPAKRLSIGSSIDFVLLIQEASFGEPFLANSRGYFLRQQDKKVFNELAKRDTVS
jgi:hypothetical protein